MKKRFLLLQCLFILLVLLFHVRQTACATERVTLKLMETTDVHGNFFSYDFVNTDMLPGGWSRILTYVNSQRDSLGNDACLLFEAGDILQGQPCVYYANFVDTIGIHLTSDMMNFMGYNAACFGNHDIEAGHPVYDRWVADCDFPVLGANVLSVSAGKSYTLPYCVLERKGVKIAILGMVTPAIPMWLPESLWSGLSFEDMVAAARKWVPYIREKEKPDVLVGLFHTGLKGGGINGFNENAAEEIALTVPGFDVLFFGHDHRGHCEEVTNRETGQKVWLLNAGGEATHVAEAVLTLALDKGIVTGKEVEGRLVSVEGCEPDSAFMARYHRQFQEVDAYVNERIGALARPIDTFDYFFGRSDMADLLHWMQFGQVKADISLVTPLTYNEVIPAGDIYVKDIFKLYRYENRIDVFRLTGREIKGALERAYALWTHTMTSQQEHALNICEHDKETARLGGATYFFLSAAGISYEVDLTRPVGDKVHVLCMRDGSAFQLDKTYRVAVNSYVGSGGGGLLTEGAGIALKELPSRIVEVSDKDLRYYLIDYFRHQSAPLDILPISDWKFVPEAYVRGALERDRRLLGD